MRITFPFASGCFALLFVVPARSSDVASNGLIARHPFPSPTNKEVVFEADFEGPEHSNLWISSIDGKSLRKLDTGCVGPPTEPTWSPDGKAVAFICAQEVMSISPDGSHLRELGHGEDATWSPDSRQVVFADGGDIWIMNADGENRGLVNSAPRSLKPQRPFIQPLYCDHPSFSPSGTQVAFSLNAPGVSASLMVVKRDGSDLHALTTGPYQDWNPQWSFFGIVFSSNRDSSGHFKPWLIQPDGQAMHKLSNAPALDPILLSSGLLIFADEMTDTIGSRIAVMDPISGMKRYLTGAARQEISLIPNVIK